MFEPKDLLKETKSKVLTIDVVHIIFFGGLIILNLVFSFKEFSLSWRDVERTIDFSWKTLFFVTYSFDWMESILKLFRWLLPVSVSSLMIFLCFKRNLSKMSPHGYTIISASVLLYLLVNVISVLIFYDDFKILLTFRYISLLIQVPIIAIPSFVFGLRNKTPLVEYQEEKIKKWHYLFLFPSLIVRKTFEIADSKIEAVQDKQKNYFFYHVDLILGFVIASHFTTIFYEGLILGTILPTAIFIVIWVIVIVIALWIIFKLIGMSSEKGTYRSEEKTSLLGKKITVHYDPKGKEVARSEKKEKLFGGEIIETRDKDGKVISRSEEKEKLFGDKYVEHRDAEGKKIGESMEKEKILGGKIIKTTDAEGKVISTSEKKTGLFGEEYLETTPKE